IMNIDNNYNLITLKKEPFIELFRIEDIDNSIFRNYQRYDFYQLLWFTQVKNPKSYFIDFREYEINENDLILLYPGQIDRLDPKGLKGYLFAIESNVLFEINQHLSSDYLNGYYSNVFLSPDKETQETLNDIIQLFLREYQAKNRLPLLQIYIESFLFHLVSLFNNLDEYKDHSHSAVAHLMKLIDKYYIDQREINFYADQMGLSPKQINLISKKGTGKTIKEHLKERLILEIKKEIRIGEKSLKEIAFNLQFSDTAYFTRFFKANAGLTPSEFKDIR
ncbi:MAG: helix-turn-helix transcriptional regulator, partial [Bacteroidales bacterium]|nr:helix-turn-helix transcriptional regulator [Bacteroidales bacterium]